MFENIKKQPLKNRIIYFVIALIIWFFIIQLFGSADNEYQQGKNIQTNWIISVFVVAGLYAVFFPNNKNNKKYRREYSLGLKIAQEIQTLIRNNNYSEVEQKVRNQNINDITQIIDHLALSLQEDELLQWNNSQQSDLSKLTLGVYYLHFAWIERSHKLAKDVSTKQAMGFYDYLKSCRETFETISTDSFYNPELESRKIRLYMSAGNSTLAKNCFHNLAENQPDFVWPFIHYAEIIQPKWGGTIEQVEQFYENLPNNFLIHSIAELKLILDAIIMGDNYFSKYNTDINAFAREKVLQIDTEYDNIEINSIHRYILYNYMAAVSEAVKLRKIKLKYEKLMNGKYTIYPYGLLLN